MSNNDKPVTTLTPQPPVPVTTDAELVAAQASCSLAVARRELEKAGGDVVEAIMALTL